MRSYFMARQRACLLLGYQDGICMGQKHWSTPALGLFFPWALFFSYPPWGLGSAFIFLFWLESQQDALQAEAPAHPIYASKVGGTWRCSIWAPPHDTLFQTMQSGGPLYTTGGEIQLATGSFVCACALCIWNIYYSKLPSAHFTIITTSVCLVISTVTNKNAIIIPVISKMDVVVRSCWLWECFQEETCALQPCLFHLSYKEILLFSVGLNLKGWRKNGDYVEKNWCERVLVGVKFSSSKLREAANGSISRN